MSKTWIRQQARNRSQRRLQFYVDVTPLFDQEWTGIPIVAAEFARRFLTQVPDQTSFFFEDHLVASTAVEDALRRRNGMYLERDFFQGEANAGALPLGLEDRTHVGFFPSVKRRRSLFDHEFSIVHDISTLLTPQFHAKENIDYHSSSLLHDLESNRITFCISSATHDDIVTYLGIPEQRLRIVGNGVSWPPEYEVRYQGEVGPIPVERYALMLGTREPRKNLQLLFDTLDLNPDLLSSIRIVITGRSGWLEDGLDVPQSVRRAIDTRQILVTGFVSDYTKYKLIKAAQFLIFPSFFEGFGLPIAEALTVGTPCLASLSSSIPEVGGDSCEYFDPLSPVSLAEGMRTMISSSKMLNARLAAGADDHVERLSWDTIFSTVIDTITASVELQEGGRTTA